MLRSGRIRKKSSKLADFQSPDEAKLPTPRKSTWSRKDLSGSMFDDPSEHEVCNYQFPYSESRPIF